MIAVLVVVFATLWAADRPAGQPAGSYLGQLLGAESVLLLSISLVLVSTLPWVETWFDGIDHAAIWHRRLAIAGLALLAPHILLAANPHGTAIGAPLGAVGLVGLAGMAGWSVLPRWRSVTPGPLRTLVAGLSTLPGVRQVRSIVGGYDRWRMLHRSTGLCVAAGFAHGLLDATPFSAWPLRWSYVAVGGIGLVCYTYREVLARHLSALHDYQVATVSQAGTGLVEISLVPLGRPVTFIPGQFAMVYLEAKDGWHRHPFTIASAAHDPQLRFTVKALGDYTSQLRDLVRPGMPAVVGGPHGRSGSPAGSASPHF